jgi:hypothetical protein
LRETGVFAGILLTERNGRADGADLMRQHAAEPVERPQAAAVIVNRAEWLEGQPTLDAQLVPGAANGERRGPRGAAFVEQMICECW